MALLLPAIQAAREAARRAECTNNLKQFGVAMHNYHDTYGALPMGVVSTTRTGGYGNIGRWSWSAYLLPYVEQEALYREIRIYGVDKNWWTYNQAVNNGTVRSMMEKKITAYRCPSDDGKDLNADRDKDSFAVARSNYIAVNSSNELATFSGPVVVSGSTVQGADGLFVCNESHPLADILDGTSNTVMIGERCTTWFSANGNQRNCWAACVFGQNNENPAINRGMADTHGCFMRAINHRLNNNRCRQAFMSRHPGGAMLCFADGKVRFVSENVNWNNIPGADSVAERLAAIADGEAIGNF
ncbi:MAG: DUF1559 domain-containing protein [Planctomycetes bacterium]|nr:DUF1559 domain-containing protein [Planctomycetota bacterium]